MYNPPPPAPASVCQRSRCLPPMVGIARRLARPPGPDGSRVSMCHGYRGHVATPVPACLSIRYGKGREPRRTEIPAGASVAGVEREESTAPGAASAARAGVCRLVLLGDPPSFDEDDSDPHCCVKPLNAVALPSLAATAACRTRHGPAASCSAPMASRLRCLVTVYGPGCLPGHRDYLKRHDSLGFDAGRLLCPLVPREPSERLARPPPAVSGCPPRPQSGTWRIRFDSPPPPVDRAAWRIRAHAGASPDATPPYSRIASLRIGTSASASTSYGAAPAPDSHRRSGLPVCRDGSRPRRHRAAPTWPLR